MAFQFYNPNPMNKRVGDCAVRAISKALEQSWETSFLELAVLSMREYDMPSANYIWGLLLSDRGFAIHPTPAICPDCITVREFCSKHPAGTYVLVCDYEHVVAVNNGDWYDTWDSGDSIVLYFYEKENN